MLYILYYLVLFANVVQSFLRRKSVLLLICTLSLLFFLFFSNDASGHDHYLYKIGFEQSDQELGFEVLYTAIVSGIKGLGVTDYNTFLAVYFVISLALQYLGLKWNLALAHPLLSLYMVFIFPQWAIAIRIFLAISIVLFSMKFLLQGKRLVYVCGIALATAVHFSIAPLAFLALFYSSDSVRKMEVAKYKSTVLKIMLCSFAVLAVASYFFAESTVYGTTTAVLSSVMGHDTASDIDNKVTSYFESKTKLGFMIFVFIYVVNLLMTLKMAKASSMKLFEGDKTLRLVANSGATINLFLSFTLPLIVLNLVFGRLMAIGSIVNMITFSIYLIRFKSLTQNTRMILLLYFVLSLLAWSVPAALEINSISPNGLIETAILYWGGVILLCSQYFLKQKKSLVNNAVFVEYEDCNGNKFNQPLFLV